VQAGDPRPLYGIGAVAALLGSTPATLRTWEDRYGVIHPQRTAGGRRVYTREDVEHLRFVKDALVRGFSAADAHRLLRERHEDPEAGDAADGPAGAQPLVLLAERDPFGAELSEYVLRAEGYDVALTVTAADAEDAFRARRPALVILELLISGGAGAGLARRLKAIGRVPLLAISPLDAGDPALEAGADAFLRKPFDPTQLVAAVEDLLARPAVAGPAAG
jgi:DNA-binding transcriptional MerR regulator